MSVIATIGMPLFLDIDFIVVPFFPLYDEHSGQHLFFFTLESSYGTAEPTSLTPLNLQGNFL